MTNKRRLEILDEAYKGTNGEYLLDGFTGHQLRESSDENGNDDDWEASAVLIEMDRIGADAVRAQVAAGKF